MRTLLALVLAICCASSAFAQAPVVPGYATSSGFVPLAGNTASSNVSTTITTTNTFQSLQIATTRRGCLIQNNGTHTMWVFFGPIASATEASAFQVPAGTPISCATGAGGVLVDQVSITGTSGDAFTANFQ